MFSRVVIGVDNVTDLINALNANADLSVASARLTTLGTFEFLDDAGNVLFSINTVGFANQLVAGLALSVSGVTPNYQLDNTDGTYSFENELISIAAGFTSITSTDTLNNRIDTVYVDADGVIKIEDGVPATFPTAPAVNGLVLAYIFVPKDTTTPTVGQSLIVTPATNYGEILFWDGAQYVPTGLMRIGTDPDTGLMGLKTYGAQAEKIEYVTTTPFLATGNPATYYLKPGAATLNLDDTIAALFDGLIIKVKNRSGGAGSINPLTKTIEGGGAEAIADGEFKSFQWSNDLDQWNKLFN